MGNCSLLYLSFSSLSSSFLAERYWQIEKYRCPSVLASFRHWCKSSNFVFEYLPATFVLLFKSQNTFFDIKDDLLLWRWRKKENVVWSYGSSDAESVVVVGKFCHRANTPILLFLLKGWKWLSGECWKEKKKNQNYFHEGSYRPFMWKRSIIYILLLGI